MPSETESWGFTVIRASNVRHLGPNKRPWKPTITLQIQAAGPVDCDAAPTHDVCLGIKGENPNQKHRIYIQNHSQNAKRNERLCVKIWHESQTKKKTKRRSLIAQSTISLSDLGKRCQIAGKTPLDIQLTPQVSRKESSSRPGPIVTLHVHPPASTSTLEANEEDSDALFDEDTETESHSSMPSTPSSTYQPLDEVAIGDEGIQGYLDDIECNPNQVPDVLPQYSERDPSEKSLAEKVVGSFTHYDEMRSASLEDQLDPVFQRLKSEWSYVGTVMVALAAVDAALFAIGQDAMFPIDSVSRTAVAVSSAASGLGIVCTGWFIFRYTFAPTPLIIQRCKDVFDSYIFFSISARVPMACMTVSAISLVTFLLIAAYQLQGASFVYIMVGAVCGMMSLQYIFLSLVKLGHGIRWCTGKLGLDRLWRKEGKEADVQEAVDETTSSAP
ncbi:hypothetical protein CYLTODRAFT_171757 [Cylindrobasidium torrendii FP15055 ss-10]|uniref:Uncharacterized protein n=1 Tax=Cylindrobasidium torrendii FP15055 ss-10 TaxID=1314674 RepID=A0A0D7BJK0_9AGAR|nr:hypothetical protein CYLTODRAFT_171757 [Cylindrobasidium torrendii FP15055 ss-10]